MGDFLSQANSLPMYLLGAGVVGFILVEAIVFLVRAYREGKRIGMDTAKLKKAISSSAWFSVVPSVGILLGVIALSGALGIPLPWIRLSVVGALHYETMAADIAATAAGMPELSAEYMTPPTFAAIALSMTVGIIWGLLILILVFKPFQRKLKKATGKDPKFSNILFCSMFIGMVSAYVGRAFADLRSGSILALLSVLVSALFMWLFTVLITKFHQKWLENFSLAFSMLLGMAAAVLGNYLLPSIPVLF